MDPKKLEKLIFNLATAINGKLTHVPKCDEKVAWSNGGEEYLQTVARIYSQLLAPHYSHHPRGHVNQNFAALPIAARDAFDDSPVNTAMHLLEAVLHEFNWRFNRTDKEERKQALRRLFDAIRDDDFGAILAYLRDYYVPR